VKTTVYIKERINQLQWNNWIRSQVALTTLLSIGGHNPSRP